ncbi:DUF928 domain-containing protein [Leptolyngbya sp. AN02str]
MVSLASILGDAWQPVAHAQYIPPDRGLPGRREGGGTRGDCAVRSEDLSSLPLIALVPETNFGVTVSLEPTLYWYVPRVAAAGIELAVFDQNDEPVYQTVVPVPDQGGVVSIPIPTVDQGSAKVSRLIANEDYHWYLSLICNEVDRSGDIFVEGWLRRIESSAELEQQLSTSTPEMKFSVYQEFGIWQDALDQVAQQLCQQPQNPIVRDRWTTLLASVQITGLESATLVSSCNSNTLAQ